MGPFPHAAAKATISAQNPAGTDGFEFVEFAHPEPAALRALFLRMGYTLAARHKSRAIELWQQGDITYVLNDEPGSHARRFVGEHGPCAPSMGWRVVDAAHAFAHAVKMGAEPYLAADRVLDVPAVVGIGGSLIYFIDQYGTADPYHDFVRLCPAKPAGVGFHYLDHLTHNVHKGNMDLWFDFYSRIFGFKQIRFFDIEGKFTGLFSRALTSACQRIRIPINEDRGETGQIVEYLKRYKGEGIQHIALICDDLPACWDNLKARGVPFMTAPPETYYAMLEGRLPGHGQNVDQIKTRGILLDGTTDGGAARLLLQIFAQPQIGPVFFEFIQRKGDEGFGEGNFKALFESIERDQIERGVLEVAE